jgi:hypothetical protein
MHAYDGRHIRVNILTKDTHEQSAVAHQADNVVGHTSLPTHPGLVERDAARLLFIYQFDYSTIS